MSQDLNSRRELQSGLNRSRLPQVPTATAETLEIVQCYPFDAPTEVVERAGRAGRKFFTEKATREETLKQLALYVAVVTGSIEEQAERFKKHRVPFDTSRQDSVVAKYASAEFLESSEEDEEDPSKIMGGQVPLVKSRDFISKARGAVQVLRTPTKTVSPMDEKSVSATAKALTESLRRAKLTASDRNREILESGGALNPNAETHPHRANSSPLTLSFSDRFSTQMSAQELESVEVAKLRAFLHFLFYVSSPPVQTRSLAVISSYSREDLQTATALKKAWKRVLKEAVLWNLALQPDPKVFATQAGLGFQRMAKSQLYNFLVEYDAFMKEGRLRYGVHFSDEVLSGHDYSPLLMAVISQISTTEKLQLDADSITTLTQAIPWAHDNIHSKKYGEYVPPQALNSTKNDLNVGYQTSRGGNPDRRSSSRPESFPSSNQRRPQHGSSPLPSQRTPSQPTPTRPQVSFAAPQESAAATKVNTRSSVTPNTDPARRDFNNSKTRWPSAAQAKPDTPAYNTRSRTASQKAPTKSAYVIDEEHDEPPERYDDEAQTYYEESEGGDDNKHDDGGDCQYDTEQCIVGDDHPDDGNGVYLTESNHVSASHSSSISALRDPGPDKLSSNSKAKARREAKKKKKKEAQVVQSQAATSSKPLHVAMTTAQQNHVDLSCDWFEPECSVNVELPEPLAISLTSEQMFLTRVHPTQPPSSLLDGHTYGSISHLGGSFGEAQNSTAAHHAVLDNCASTSAISLSLAKEYGAKQVGTAVLSSITSKDEKVQRVVRPIFAMFYRHPVIERTVRFLCVGVPDDALPRPRGTLTPAPLLLGLKMLNLIRCDLNRHLYSGSFLSQPVPPVFFLDPSVVYTPFQTDTFPKTSRSSPLFQPKPTSTSIRHHTSQVCTMVPTCNFAVGHPSVYDDPGMLQLHCLSTSVHAVEIWDDPHEYLKATDREDDHRFGPYSGLPFERDEDGRLHEFDAKTTSLHYGSGTQRADNLLNRVAERIANEKDRLRDVSESCFLSEAKVRFLMEKKATYWLQKGNYSVQLHLEDRVMAGVSKDLTPDQRRKALFMVRKAISRGVFSDRPGLINGMEPFRPKLVFPEGKLPRSMPPQRLGEYQQKVVDIFVQECLLHDTHVLMNLEDVPFATQVVISCANPTSDCPKLRVNFNEKPTNAFDAQTHTQLPNINTVKEESVGFNYYCTADGTKCFNQRELHHEVAKWYAVHVGRGQVLVPKVMIFGGKSMATECQRMVEDVFKGIPAKHQAIYVDDISWRAMTFDHLVDIVTQALDMAADRNFTLSPDKFLFGYRQIRVLGHMVSAAGMKPSPDLLAEIEKAETAPRNAAECASVLGLFRYYKKDTPLTNFAQLCKIVSSFDTCSVEERNAAFKTLRSAILGAPGLAVFDPALPLVCDSDASNSGGGFFIAHMIGMYTDARGRKLARQEKPIAYHSWVWNESQSKWVIYVKECFAFVNCIDHGRWYFACSKHVPLFRFDQRAILWIRNARSPMVARWVTQYIGDVDFELQYREGKDHSNADGVSRWPFRLELISPGNPSSRGILEAVEVLLNSGFLPNCDRKQRYLLHAPDVEQLIHQQLVTKGFTERASLVTTPTLRVFENEWAFCIAAPTAEKSITITHSLLTQPRAAAVLMPSDLVGYLPDRTLVEQCSKIVFLADNMVWLIMNSKLPKQVSAFTTDSTTASVILKESMERLPFDDVNSHAAYVVERPHSQCSPLSDAPESMTVCVLNDGASDQVPASKLCPPMPFTRQQFRQVSDEWWPNVQDMMSKHLTQLGATLTTEAGLHFAVMPNYSSPRLLVPPTLRSQLIMYYHKLYHHTAAPKRAVDVMSLRFYWINMLTEVEAQIRSCVFCAVAKARVQTASVPYSHLFASAPNDVLGIDFVGPLTLASGKAVRLLTCRDFFGRPGMRLYEEVPDLTAESAYRVLNTRQLWRRGLPRSIFSDRASCFRGKLMTMLCAQLGIETMFTGAYSAWQLAVVERDHALINTFLLSLTSHQADNLSLVLPQFEALQNDVPNADGISANSLEYTYVARRPVDVVLTPPTQVPPDSEVPVQHLHEWVRLAHEVTALHRAAVLHEQTEYRQRQQLTNASIKRPHVFQVGDRVAVYRVQESPGVSSKMLLHWWFPCRVTSVVASNLYSVINEITQETTDASGPCMVHFKPSTDDAKAFLQTRTLACNKPWPQSESQSARDPQLPVTSNDLRPGTVIALHASESATPNAFWLGRVQSIDSSQNEIVVHYYATQIANLTKATFRLAWSITTPGVDLHKKILSDSKPRSHATAPYTGVEQLSNVITVGITFTAASRLDSASRSLLDGRIPEPI